MHVAGSILLTVFGIARRMRITTGSRIVRNWVPGLLCALIAACALPMSAQNLNKAEELYRHTAYEASLSLLDKNTTDARSLFLIGRDYFMLGEFKKSSEYLQKASAGEAANAEYLDWLGRALGRRAESATVVTAPVLASKARQAFERSVELDPKNGDALSDLFEYYLEAPGFLGGGYEKALGIANQVTALNPAEGYLEKAKLAQKRKEYASAEQQLRQAVAAAPHSVPQLIELAKFLANQGRTRDSDAVLQQARTLAPESPKIWFARADIYIKGNRNLDEAKDLLRKYLQASLTVEDPPKQEAFRLLKQVGGA